MISKIMNTDILEYTLAKFRETNDFDKHFNRIAFHQYCIDQATNSKDIEEVNKFKYVLRNFAQVKLSDIKNNIGYLEECIARMKKKTRLFIRLLRQFSTSFKIIRQADVDDEKSQLNDNSYIINCRLGKMNVLMTIVDIPHMTSSFYIVKVDGIKCDDEVYHNIAMDSPDAYENFMNFIFWVKAAKME